MNNIADANATEMRGWVMLMLQRAAENVNPSECNDPAVLLACSLGSDSCPAACQKSADEASDEEPETSNINDMPIAGDLTIAVADYSDSVKSAPRVGTLVFNAVDFKSSEKVTIESVKLERTGLSSKSDIKGVWFEKDGVAVSAKASLSSDGTVTTRFYNNYSVDGTDTLDLVAELNASAGAEIAFNIIGTTSTAKNVSANTKTTTYRATTYDVVKVNFIKKGSAASYKVGEKTSYEIGAFQIANENSASEDKAIVVKSLKLRNTGTADIATLLKNVYVTRDSKTISKKVEINGKDLIIYFDNEEIASGKKGLYTIYAEVASLDRVGDTVQLELRKNTELVANEKTTNFRVAYNAALDNAVALNIYTFNGGKTTFANATNYPKNVEAAASSSDVELANGTLTVSEPVKLEGLVIGAKVKTRDTWASFPAGISTTAAENEYIINQHINDLKVEIGGSTYNAKVVACAGLTYPVNATTTAAHDAAASTVCYKIDDEMYVSKTSDVKVLVNLKWDDHKDVIEFTNIKWTSFTTVGEYDESGSKLYPSDMAGSVQVAQLTVKPGKFNITNKSSTNQKVVKNSTEVVTIFDGEISTNKGTVSVNKLTLTDTTTITARWAAVLGASDQITLTLYVNGEAFADEILDQWKIDTALDKYVVSFANLGDLSSSETMKIKITAQPNVATDGKDFTFKVSAIGTDGNGNDVEASTTNTAKLSITDSASITIANSSAKSEVVRDGSNSELLSFSTTVKDGSYNLNSVVLSFDNVDTNVLSDVTLKIDGKAVDTQSVNSTTKKVTYAINETLSAEKHTISFEGNLNVSATAANNKISISKVELDGDKAASSNLNIVKYVAEAYPTLSASTSSDDLILKITNPSDSDEDITILGFGIKWDIVAASIDGESIGLWAWEKDFNTQIAEKAKSIAAGQSIELRVQAAKSSTVQVNAIKVKAGNQTYVVTDSYTNVGSWASFKVTASGDKLPAAYTRLAYSAASESAVSGTTSYTTDWTATAPTYKTITVAYHAVTVSAAAVPTVAASTEDAYFAGEKLAAGTYHAEYDTGKYRLITVAAATAPTVGASDEWSVPTSNILAAGTYYVQVVSES